MLTRNERAARTAQLQLQDLLADLDDRVHQARYDAAAARLPELQILDQQLETVRAAAAAWESALAAVADDRRPL